MVQNPFRPGMKRAALSGKQGDVLLDRRVQKTLFKHAFLGFCQSFLFQVTGIQIYYAVEKRGRVEGKKPLRFGGVLLPTRIRPKRKRLVPRSEEHTSELQ